MKSKIVIIMLVVFSISGCSTYSVDRDDPETKFLYPSEKEFIVKVGQRVQPGDEKYLVVGTMEYEGVKYSVVRLPHDLMGMLFYALVDAQGNIHHRYFSPVDEDDPIPESTFIRVPGHTLKIIPGGVRLLPHKTRD